MVVQGPGSSGRRASRVTTTRRPGRMAKSAARARRIAAPSACHDAGRTDPARPPPVTNSWTKTVRPGAETPMQLIPVIDLKAGQAVRAVAGDRAHYQPLRSVLHAGGDPIGLASACREIFD